MSKPQTLNQLFADEEKVVSFSDLKEEQEYGHEEYENSLQLYDNTIEDFVEGELVVGRVIAISQKDVSIDIGFKSEGLVAMDEFTDPEELKIGDEIEVFIDNVENV